MGIVSGAKSARNASHASLNQEIAGPYLRGFFKTMMEVKSYDSHKLEGSWWLKKSSKNQVKGYPWSRRAFFFALKFPRDFEEQAEMVQLGVNVLLLQRGWFFFGEKRSFSFLWESLNLSWFQKVMSFLQRDIVCEHMWLAATIFV